MCHRTSWLCAVLVVLTGCTGTNVSVNRGFDEVDDAQEYYDTMSPEAFVDRLGEPDEWRNQGEGDRLEMTAIWSRPTELDHELPMRGGKHAVLRGWKLKR